MFWADAQKGARQRETLTLTHEFHMKGVRYESQHWSAVPDGALDCEVQESSLECASTFRGNEGRGSIPVRGAYATQFGAEIALLDVPWFFATLVSHAERDAQSPSPAGVVSLALDGDSRERLVTANPRTGEIQYLGREQISVLGRSVNSLKFKVSARHYDATVWTSEKGLLLAVDWGGLRLDLTRYRQFEDLVPELQGIEATERVEPKETPSSATRTKVAEGGFYYSSEAAGQFVGGWTDEWVLWRTAEGYELETLRHMQGRPEKSRVRELLRVTKEFRITFFHDDSPPWWERKDTFMECGLVGSGRDARVECHNTMVGSGALNVFPIKPPYVFEVSEEEPFLDWPWTYASMVSAAARDTGKPTQVRIAYLNHGPTEDGRILPTATGTKEILYLGREQITIVGRSISAHKYRVADEMIVWVAENGMPLMLEDPHHPRRWELKRYKQYEPFIPELR